METFMDTHLKQIGGTAQLHTAGRRVAPESESQL